MIEKLKTFPFNAFVILCTALALAGMYTMITGNQTVANAEQPAPAQQAAATETDSARSKQAAPIPVQTSVLEPSEWLIVKREFPGQIEALADPELAFEATGTIETLSVREGDFVLEGQPLVSLAVKASQLDMRRIDAARKGISAQLQLADEEFASAGKLGAVGAISQTRLSTSRATRDELRARLAEVDAELALARFRLSQSTLVAPFDGVIGEINISKGDTVAAGAPVMRLYQTGPTLLRVGLPPEIDPGTMDGVQVEIGTVSYPAKVKSVLPNLDAATLTRTVLFEYRQSGQQPAFGTQGLLQAFVAEPLEGVWVPLDALRAGVGNLWTILVVDNDNTVAAVAVDIHHIDDTRAYVSGALTTGDRIITGGVQKVTPGQTVRAG